MAWQANTHRTAVIWWGFLHKGLQSRVSEWCSCVLAEVVYAELLRLSQPLTVITPLNKARMCMKTKDQSQNLWQDFTPIFQYHALHFNLVRYLDHQCHIRCCYIQFVQHCHGPVFNRLTPYTRPNIMRFLHATAMPVSVTYNSSHHMPHVTSPSTQQWYHHRQPRCSWMPMHRGPNHCQAQHLPLMCAQVQFHHS